MKKILFKKNTLLLREVCFVLLTLFLLFTFANCERENEATNSVQESHLDELRVQKIPEKEAFKNTELVQKLSKIAQKGESANGKIIYDSIYNFTIDTDYAIFIDDGISQTYTFPVIRSNQNYISENLVIKLEGSNTQAILVDYGIDISLMKNMSLEQIEQLNERYFLIDLDTSVYTNLNGKTEAPHYEYSCTDVYVWGQVEYHEGDLTGGPLWEEGWIYQGTSCTLVYVEGSGGDSTDSGSGSSSNNDNGENSGSGITGTIGSNGSGTLNTSPTALTPEQITKKQIIRDFTDQLSDGSDGSPNQKQCYDNLPQDVKDDLNNYLGTFALTLYEELDPITGLENSDIKGVFLFAEQALEALCNGEVDSFENFLNDFINDSWGEDENAQQRNTLCGSYNFVTVGNASVVNISGLGMSVRRGHVGMNIEFTNSLCVTIPYTIPAQASSLFNTAWNVTISEVYTYLNATYTLTSPSYETLKSLLIEFLRVNLGLIQLGANISTNPCTGSIPISQATYCP
ncbi:hypothetical protein NHF50_08920 [Flavobacterium sp. NRK F10]|uniref:hypothetical protein n=1 Tax=Flavobacterium sp. NRK F10 TaxID=2954931 RepID=UPI00209011A7|nr:hypothetical protein [Flavobacterium sp. NRK F10]MCO6175169.1 hypothetical protein [Flavobacterium sp. NRK F10]